MEGEILSEGTKKVGTFAATLRTAEGPSDMPKVSAMHDSLQALPRPKFPPPPNKTMPPIIINNSPACGRPDLQARGRAVRPAGEAKVEARGGDQDRAPRGEEGGCSGCVKRVCEF